MGVRKDKWDYAQNKSLSEKDYKKYYSNGRLNRKGKRAKRGAESTRRIGSSKRTLGFVAALTGASITYNYHIGGKEINRLLHDVGNIKVTKMKYSGVSIEKRRAVAGAFIAAMGAVTLMELAPAINVAKGVRYRASSKYKAKVDTIATMKTRESKQRDK